MALLIHPPVAKPCEPPAGIARLSAMLGIHGIEHRLLDANIEGLRRLLRMPAPAEKSGDSWTRRAFRNLERNLSSMKDPGLYRNLDRYRRAVKDIGKALNEVSPHLSSVGLVNYEHKGLSPLRSGDLLEAAEMPELNPFYPYFQARLTGLFRDKMPSTVGVSLNYLSQALCAFSIIGYIRREFPAVKIILGGGLVTSWLRSGRRQNPFNGLVEHLVDGPGEVKLLSLLGMDAAKDVTQPDYHLLPRNEYLSPGFVLPYSASSGCYWNRCGFCPEKAEANPYVLIPPQRAIEDLRGLTDENDPALIHLLDNAVSPALLEALAGCDLRVPWYGFVRAGSHLADPDFCAALRKSGCVMLKLGIESGDQGVLDALQKGINLETASRVLRNLKKAGIASYVYLIFGTPVENEASACKTLDFTVRHSDCISFLNLAIFNMPVCGDAGPSIEKRDFYEGDLSLYTDFIHPAGWDRKAVRLFLDNKFRRHPSIARIMKNEPPVFTSNHAPFFAAGSD